MHVKRARTTIHRKKKIVDPVVRKFQQTTATNERNNTVVQNKDHKRHRRKIHNGT